MIKVVDNGNGKECIVNLEGNAEEIALQYVAVTMEISKKFPAIMQRASHFLQEVSNGSQTNI